jgi:hypothetical protein
MWMAGLLYLMLINPYDIHHFTFCPLKNLGFNFCPGCGLGLSISKIFHFDFIGSFETHPLGMPALIIISNRIYVLLKLSFSSQLNFNS